MIEKFSDLMLQPVNSPYLPPTIVNNIQERMRIEELTPLQNQSFNSDEFWGNSNIIIQGATSSGKTLVAEVAAANCIHHSQQEKRVIYLVPLKAMVSEKYRQFKRDMSGENYNWHVCPSSADYQNFDEDILGGNFNIAVIVYEKFFAFLAQNQNGELLHNCGLIIIDEIQMLSEIDRGAKLEFAITKVREDYPQIRIMGLTTIYCDTTALETWMDATHIRNVQRSCDLHEFVVITNGRYRVKHRKKEDESNFEEEVGTLGGYTTEKQLKNKIEERKAEILLELIRAEVQAASKATNAKPIKIIVFAHSKRKTIKLAEMISNSNLLPQQQIEERLLMDLNQQDDDEIITKMTQLMQHSVAYHNSSLPQGTRVLVENEFDKGSVHVIVATATLAIGLNLPADVIILFDHIVNKDGKLHEIEAHSYKNYIGRAGRLGLTNRPGKSFLLVDTQGEMNGCWDRYVNAATKEIGSVLSTIGADDLAPFYLNYIAGGGGREISSNDLIRFSSATFGHSGHDFENEALCAQILKDLVRARLVEESDEGLMLEGFDDSNQRLYEITPYGAALAPFALPLRTSMLVMIYFLQSTIGKKIGGLPDAYTFEDVNNEKYLLDILYRVCLTEEIERLSFLQMPKTNSCISIGNAIVKYITSIAMSGGLWENSPLFKFLSQPMGTRYETAAMRAIILIHWYRGEYPKEIKQKTGISLPISIGDLDHLSEVCSYIIEAISRSFREIKRYDDKMVNAFYTISVRIKYGLPLTWVRIRNRHVTGITRKTLIKLSRDDIMKAYDSPQTFLLQSKRSEWIRYFTPIQRDELLKSHDDLARNGNIKILLRCLLDDGLITQSQIEAFEEVNDPSDHDKWNDSLLSILSFIGINASAQGVKRVFSFNDINFFLPYFAGDEMLRVTDFQMIHDISNFANNKKLIVICRNGFEAGVLEAFDNTQKILCIDSSSFINLILQCIYTTGSVSKKLVVNILMDLYGEAYNIDAQKLLGTVKNYSIGNISEKKSDKDEALYILYDHRGSQDDMEDFQSACNKHGINFNFIRWGDNKFSYINNIIKAKHPVFVYFSDINSIHSSYLEFQIQSIISGDLYREKERKIFLLWKNDEVFKEFSEKYTYFNQTKGNIKGDRNMETIVTELKESIEV